MTRMNPQRIAQRVNRWIERAVPWLAALCIAMLAAHGGPIVRIWI